MKKIKNKKIERMYDWMTEKKTSFYKKNEVEQKAWMRKRKGGGGKDGEGGGVDDENNIRVKKKSEK